MHIIPSLNGTCYATPVRRPGTKFVCELDGPVDRLEAVQRGNWCFLRVHMKDGTVRDILPDGEPVITRGGT